MTALPTGLAAALIAAGQTAGEWGDLAGELRLFMEQQQTDLHNTHLLALNLSMEVDQMRAQLLAMPAAAPAGPRNRSQGHIQTQKGKNHPSIASGARRGHCVP